MLPPLAASPAIASAAAQPAQAAGGLPDIQLANRPQTPTAQDGAEFARAAAQSAPVQGTPIQGAPVDMPAAMPQPADGIGGTLMRQVEQMTRHMSGLQDGMAPRPPATPGAAGSDHADMDRAVAQIEHAYTFAIETTMASRGSTESTKIFNTLLKGQ